MTWHRFPTHLLRSDGPTIFFREVGSRETGDFRLWLDPDGGALGFQLSHAQTENQPEYFAEWHRGRSLRLGEVDGGEPAAAGLRPRMSPIIRSSSRPATQIAEQLLAYFNRNAGVLEPPQRELVQSILAAAMGGDASAVSRPSSA
jgi:hypothetical protein